MKIDLHLHTTASDGTDSPEELVERAARGGFDAIAVTDHDTLDGLKPAIGAGRRLGLFVIPGVEISAGGDQEVHLLGYGVEEDQGLLRETLADMRSLRNQRMHQMVERLNGMGVRVQLAQVMDSAQGSVGRSHLARILVRGGDARDVRDAFNRYLSPGRPAYVPRKKLTLERAVELIRSSGGVPVIAHPGQNRADLFWLKERLRPLIGAGLMGFEVYHPAHSPAQVQQLDAMARELGLLVTGGSDYHGTVKTVSMGDGLREWRHMDGDYQKLMDAISDMKK